VCSFAAQLFKCRVCLEGALRALPNRALPRPASHSGPAPRSAAAQFEGEASREDAKGREGLLPLALPAMEAALRRLPDALGIAAQPSPGMRASQLDSASQRSAILIILCSRRECHSSARKL